MNTRSARQKSILLAGMKHCGKSTLARMLAWEMKAKYYDLDDMIEEAYRSDRMLSCREIYIQHGKQFFMDLETEAAHTLSELMRDTFVVASLGGGTIENEPALAALAPEGIFVYLQVEAGTLFKRISRGGIPPFLSKEHPAEDFQILFEKRTSLLAKRADISVDLPDAEIPQSLERLANSIKENGYAW